MSPWRKIVSWLLVLVGLGGAYLLIWGIRVDATNLAFAERPEMQLFASEGNSMKVRLPISPASKALPEFSVMFWAARLRLPLYVTLPTERGPFTFGVAGLSHEGDFEVPCFSNLDCTRVLSAAKLRLPVELTSKS